MSDVRIVMNPEWAHELAGPDGPIAKGLEAIAEPVLAAMKEGVGHDTDQLANSLGIAAVEVEGKVEIRVGVTDDTREGDTVTNSQLLRWEEFGNGREPALHVASQALLAQ